LPDAVCDLTYRSIQTTRSAAVALHLMR